MVIGNDLVAAAQAASSVRQPSAHVKQAPRVALGFTVGGEVSSTAPVSGGVVAVGLSAVVSVISQTAISACEQGSEWQLSLFLLSEMRPAKLATLCVG